MPWQAPPPGRVRDAGAGAAGGLLRLRPTAEPSHCAGRDGDPRRAVAANARGYAQALRFADSYASGTRVWAVEGAGHYGAALARFLGGRGETVLEAGRSPRGERRLQRKDDGLDAIRAARAALGNDELGSPRAGQRREALRLLLVARRSAVDVRREALVQLRSVIVTSPDRLRDELCKLPVQRLLDRCSRLRRSKTATPDELASTSPA